MRLKCKHIFGVYACLYEPLGVDSLLLSSSFFSCGYAGQALCAFPCLGVAAGEDGGLPFVAVSEEGFLYSLSNPNAV